jgi:hypothetical protein
MSDFADDPRSRMRLFKFREPSGRYGLDLRDMSKLEFERVLAALRGGSHFGRSHPAAVFARSEEP